MPDLGSTIRVEDHALVFVVRADGEPGLYLRPDVCKGHAVLLFDMMSDRLRQEVAADA